MFGKPLLESFIWRREKKKRKNSLIKRKKRELPVRVLLIIGSLSSFSDCCFACTCPHPKADELLAMSSDFGFLEVCP